MTKSSCWVKAGDPSLSVWADQLQEQITAAEEIPLTFPCRPGRPAGSVGGSSPGQ